MSESKRGTFGPVVLVGVLAAAMSAVASSKTWAELGSRDAKLVATWIGSSGELPAASALSLAALASWGALLVSRGRWRRWIAALGLVIAVASLVTAIVGYSQAPSDLRHAAENSLGNALSSSPALTGWYWVAVVADLLVVLALLVAVRDAPAWPTMSSRYDSPTASHEPREMKSSLDVWKALDEGADPTDTER
jgi:uncharacterized membrane protein (TIGR02234 family)